MKDFIIGLTTLFYIGTIDAIEDNVAHVEFRTTDSQIYEADIPIYLFPCQIAEGDPFYVDIIDGVTEIRCGDPPE